MTQHDGPSAALKTKPLGPPDGDARTGPTALLRRPFSSLHSTFKFMVSSGLLMGIVFPFYSYLFFGAKAFAPLYVLGCLTAGFLVGRFCYFVIKQVLRFHVERQWETLRQFPGAGACMEQGAKGRDELQTLVQCRDGLMTRVLGLIESVTAISAAIRPLTERLVASAGGMVANNARQVSEVHKSQGAVEEMRGAFAGILGEVETIASRSEERASISAQMSAAASEIAGGMVQHAEMVRTTSASIEEIAEHLSRTRTHVEELSDSTAQTSTSILQITHAIADVRDFAQETKKFSERVQADAQEGREAMNATLATMGKIAATAEESFQAISRLSLSAAKVGGVLVTIQDVAERTNLLSLNATIIAAQAGEKGKAFSVVAEEVRTLAHRTAFSTKEIAELVRDMRSETQSVQHAVTNVKSRVDEGVQVSAAADAALAKIQTGAVEASQKVSRIAEAAVAQAADGRLISEEATKNLDRLTRVTRAVQEQEAAISAMVRTVDGLRSVSEAMTATLQEMAENNRQYLQHVVADSDRVKELRNTSEAQLVAAKGVVAFVRETGGLIETNAAEAALIVHDIEAIVELAAKFGRAVAQPGVVEESAAP